MFTATCRILKYDEFGDPQGTGSLEITGIKASDLAAAETEARRQAEEHIRHSYPEANRGHYCVEVVALKAAV